MFELKLCSNAIRAEGKSILMKKYVKPDPENDNCPLCGGEKGHERGTPGRISCNMAEDNPDNPKIKPEITFLKAKGQHALVSLGCGS